MYYWVVMREFASFKKICESYRVIFFDACGVLKSSMGLFTGIGELLSKLKRQKKYFFVISNDASKSPAMSCSQYKVEGHGKLLEERQIITSGMLATKYLETNFGDKLVCYLGPDHSCYYLEKAGCQTVDLLKMSESMIASAFVLLNSDGFDCLSGINKVVNLVRRLPEIELIAPNPDLIYPLGNGQVAVASGGLASLIENILGKKFIYFGKPNSDIFNYAVTIAKEYCHNLKISEILMVGDTISTDIVGAQRVGMDSALVLTGNTNISNYEIEVNKAGVEPNYLLTSLLS